jgi:hypothetical protein
MTRLYTIHEGSPDERQAVRSYLPHLDLLPQRLQEMVVTAWTTVWRSSAYDELEAMPYSLHAPTYRLMHHVREVGDLGLALARWAEPLWQWAVPVDDLIPVLLLHDVDKPLLYTQQSGRLAETAAGRQVPHGVLGGFLLRDLGFNDTVVTTVTTHAANSPFHGEHPLAMLLHYADFFSADHALMLAGAVPFYQRHWLS